MTTDVLSNASPVYTVSNAGPFTIPFPYSGDDDITVYAGTASPLTKLATSKYTVSPASSDTSGAITLTAAAYATHAGQQLMIRRATIQEQAWVAQAGTREAGVEAQMDRTMRAVQDIREDVRRAVKVAPGSTNYDLILPDPTGSNELLGYDSDSDLTLFGLSQITAGNTYQLGGFSELATLLASTAIEAGLTYLADGRLWRIVSGAPYTVNGATVHTLTGISGQAVLAPREMLDTAADFFADTRPQAFFAAGQLVATLDGALYEISPSPFDVENAGGARAIVRSEVANVTHFGAVMDGSPGGGEALQAAIDGLGWAYVPHGELLVDQIISAEDELAWNGIRGNGHESRILLDDSSYFLIQTRDPGGAGGVTDWVQQGISDLTIDGQGVAPVAIVLGADPDLGQTDIDLSTNGMRFDNLTLWDIDGPAIRAGFSTACSFYNLHCRLNDYGFKGETLTDSSACDVHAFYSPKFRASRIAAICVISNSVNRTNMTFHDAFVADNPGWGAFLANINGALNRDDFVFIGGHFENNGSKSGVNAADVEVPEHGGSRDPGHVYARAVTVRFIGTVFTGGFIEGRTESRFDFDGGSISNDGTNFFGPCVRGVIIELGGGLSLENPNIATLATVIYSGEVSISGNAADRQVIAARMPEAVTFGAPRKSPDPSMAFGQGGFTASTGSPPTLSSTYDDIKEGGKYLTIDFGSTAGNLNANCARFDGIGTVPADQYVAVTVFLKSDQDTTIRFEPNVSEYGNNMGPVDIELLAGNEERISILWHNRDTDAAATSMVFGMYPVGTDAPQIKVRYPEVAVGRFREVLPVLNGEVGTPAPITKQITWNPGSMAAGAQEARTGIVMTGARVGDMVEVAGPALGGLILHGEVSASDTVALYITNVTAGAVDPAEQPYQIKVMPT